MPSRHYCICCLGCRAVLCFSQPFFILAAIFIDVPFSSLPSILSLFSQQLSRLFIQCWTFFLLSCCFCFCPVVAIHFTRHFRCDYRSPPRFFFYSSYRSSRHFHTVMLFMLSLSTGSNSHTSSFQALHPTLQHCSIPIKKHEHAYQSFVVVYDTGKVRQLCGYSTLAGAVKV